MSTGPSGLGTDQARSRVLAYVASVVVAVGLYTVVYRYAMLSLEGVEISWLHSLEVVVQSFTTTGYGEQADSWDHDGMFLLAVAMQFTGVALIFLALPLFLVPLVEDALRTDPPARMDLTDHVIICTYTPRGDTLVTELDSRDVPYVVVESDRDRAASLHDQEYSVVHGDPESVSVLRAAGAESADALVADDDDETNASVILSAREAAPDLDVVSLVEDLRTADYHRYAGATRVVSPRHLLADRLAAKATTAVSTELGDAVEIGEDFEIAELLVQRDAELVGKRVSETRLGEVSGATVIGAWFRGDFVSPPAPDAVIDEHTVLLVVGREERLERLKELTLSRTRRHRRGTVVVAGYGEVGARVVDRLAEADVSTVVVDEVEKPGVDVVGDATEQSTLAEADVESARSIILALDSDRTTMFASLAVKQAAPDIEVIARANETESVGKLYRAGAEYVLALATVSGRMLASSFSDEEVLSPDTQIELVRTEAPNLVGRSLAGANVRARTNCTVVAVERNGELVTELGPEFVVEAGDDLIVAGTDADVNRFNELAG